MRTLLIIVLGVFVLTGCGRNTNNNSVPQQNQAPNAQIHSQQTNPTNHPGMTPDQIRTHLEQLAMSIPQVQHAHCVIIGKTAVVGIDVVGDLPRARVDNTKYSVAEALRKDPYGVNAIVTADIDLDNRLKNIRQQIMNGHPITGFADEMGKIMGRIVPQLPKDINPKNSPPPRTENSDNFIKKNL
jgi:YhcN/YlaJ family sporulation lipoprotein